MIQIFSATESNNNDNEQNFEKLIFIHIRLVTNEKNPGPKKELCQIWLFFKVAKVAQVKLKMLLYLPTL